MYRFIKEHWRYDFPIYRMDRELFSSCNHWSAFTNGLLWSHLLFLTLV